MARDVQPTVAVRGNLQWTSAGLVTATYLVSPLDYGLRSAQDKADVKLAHQYLIQELPDDSLLFGLQAPMDLRDMLARMVAGVDLDTHDDFADEAAAAYDRMAAIAPTTRIMGLTIPVGKVATTAGVAAWFTGRAATPAPTAEDLAEYRDTAQTILSKVGASFDPVPVPAAFFQWLWEHNLTRGVRPLPAPVDASRSEFRPTRTAFRGAALDEGAQSDAGTRIASRTPLIKVIPTDDDLPVGYQSMLTVTSFPYEGAIFPGGTEFLQAVDAVTAGTVDWAMRVSRRHSDEVIKKNTKALRQVDEQIDQRSSETSFARDTLAAKIQMLSDYTAHLEANNGESEVQFTTVFAIGSPTAQETADAANALKRKFKRLKMEITAPVGVQVDLWSMMLPGARNVRAFSDYAHITSTDLWAAFVPFTSSALGDSQGPVVAVNLLSGQFDPVHADILGTARKGISPSFACCGELGSGKSYFIKSMCEICRDSGGRFLAIDRTKTAEYETFVSGMPDSKVVNLARPKFSLDPLRLFQTDGDPESERIGIDYTVDVMLPLLDLSPTDREGVVFTNLLRAESRREHNIVNLARLVSAADHLGSTQTADAQLYAGVASRLRAWVDRAPVLFDPSLPVLDLSASATVIRTHELSLPEPEEMQSEHLYRRLSQRKRLGSTLYELVAIAGRHAFFGNPDQFDMFVCDEAHHLVQTPVGRNVTTEYVRDGRKNNTAIALASHDPVADYAGVSLDLIPTRYAFRHRDEKLARNALTWLGIDVEANPHLVKQLTKQTSPVVNVAKNSNIATADDSDQVLPERRGECFIRDGQGRIGRGKILGTAREHRRDSMNTNPGELVNQ